MKIVKDPFGFTLESPEEIEAFERWQDAQDADHEQDLHSPERAAADDMSERERAWEEFLDGIENEPEVPEWMEEVSR